MKEEKGKTFIEIVTLLSVFTLFVGLAICLLSLFHCTELDYTEAQRNACKNRAGIVFSTGLLTILGSGITIICGVFSLKK